MWMEDDDDNHDDDDYKKNISLNHFYKTKLY